MKLHKRKSGQGLVEYALLLVLIAIVLIVVMTLLGQRINMIFARIFLEMENPGEYSGSPVTASVSVNASASCNPVTNACSGVSATAVVTVRDELGNSVSAPAHVVFSHAGSSVTKTGTGGVNSGNLGTGTAGGSVQACVIAVTGYSLVGQSCASGSY